MFTLVNRIGLPVVAGLSAVEAIAAVSPVAAHPSAIPRPLPYRAYAVSTPERRPARKAADLMAQPVTTLPEEATVDEARRLFVARRFRHVPVVGPDGQLVGILSDRDLLPAPNGGLAVSELMSSPVWTAAPESPLREVASLMFDRRVGALPILDEGALVGILTRSDILRSLLVEPPLDLWIR